MNSDREWAQGLADVLVEMAEAERNVELARERLRGCKGYSLDRALHVLGQHGVVTLAEIRELLEGWGVELDGHSLEILWRELDRDGDGRVAGQDWQWICGTGNAAFSDVSLDEALVAVLREILVGTLRFRDLAERLIPVDNRNLSSMFDSIDVQRQGSINLADMLNFLRSFHPRLPLTLAQQLITKLDLDGDLMVSRDDWIRSFFQPGLSGQISTGRSRNQTQQDQPYSNESRSTQNFKSDQKMLGVTMRSTAAKTMSESKLNGTYLDNSTSPYGQPSADRQLREREIRAGEQTANKFIQYSAEKDPGAVSFRDDDNIREIAVGNNSASKMSNNPGMSFNIHRSSPMESLPPQAQKRVPIFLQLTTPNETRPTAQSDDVVFMDASSARQPVRDSQQIYIDAGGVTNSGYPPTNTFTSRLNNQRDDERSLATHSVSQSYLDKNNGESRRYVKPNANESSPNRYRTDKSTSRQLETDQAVLEKFERLKKKREELQITIERDATRGVLNEDDPQQKALKHKPLTFVPTEEIPEGWERSLENSRKSPYDALVFTQSLNKYDTEQRPFFEAESYSPYDISGGKTYPFRRPGYTSVAPQDTRTAEYIVAILSDMIRDFRIIEQKKMNLAMRFDFRVQELFELADLSQTSSISVHDLAAMAAELDIDLQMGEAMKLFSVYDTDKDRYLNFDDFAEMFLPFNCEFRDALTAKSTRKMYEYSYFQRDTLKAIKDCLASLFNVERNMTRYKQQLKGHEQELFDLLDSRQSNSICLEDILSVLARHGHNASPLEVTALIRRMDRDRDGLISPSEWFGFLKEFPEDYESHYMDSRRGQLPSELVINPPETIHTTNTHTRHMRVHCHPTPVFSCEKIIDCHGSTRCGSDEGSAWEEVSVYSGEPRRHRLGDPLYPCHDY